MVPPPRPLAQRHLLRQDVLDEVRRRRALRRPMHDGLLAQRARLETLTGAARLETPSGSPLADELGNLRTQLAALARVHATG